MSPPRRLEVVVRTKCRQRDAVSGRLEWRDLLTQHHRGPHHEAGRARGAEHLECDAARRLNDKEGADGDGEAEAGGGAEQERLLLL